MGVTEGQTNRRTDKEKKNSVDRGAHFKILTFIGTIKRIFSFSEEIYRIHILHTNSPLEFVKKS